MTKKELLIEFGNIIKNRRMALNLSLRDVEKLSNISAALITKLENGKMPNFPKAITIKQLSDALRFNNELFVIADILFEPAISEFYEKTVEEELRELLATRTSLTYENIMQVVYFVSGLEKLQKIEKFNK